MLVRSEAVVLAVEVDKPASISAYPQVALFVFCKGIYIIVAQAVRIGGAIAVKPEFDDILMIKAYSFFKGADPDDVVIIHKHGNDTVLAQAFIVLLVIGNYPYGKILFIYQVNAAVVGAYPDVSLFILHHAPHEVIAQR